MQDTLQMYKNYLYALRERQEYGDKYGDTDELIKMYEENLNIKKPKQVEEDIKILDMKRK